MLAGLEYLMCLSSPVILSSPCGQIGLLPTYESEMEQRWSGESWERSKWTVECKLQQSVMTPN